MLIFYVTYIKGAAGAAANIFDNSSARNVNL